MRLRWRPRFRSARRHGDGRSSGGAGGVCRGDRGRGRLAGVAERLPSASRFSGGELAGADRDGAAGTLERWHNRRRGMDAQGIRPVYRRGPYLFTLVVLMQKAPAHDASGLPLYAGLGGVEISDLNGCLLKPVGRRSDSVCQVLKRGAELCALVVREPAGPSVAAYAVELLVQP